MRGIDHIFSMTDESAHTALKMQIGPALSPSPQMEDCVEGQIVRLLHLVDTRYISTKGDFRAVDFAVLVHYFAIDMIGALIYGAPFGFLDEGLDVFGYLKWNDDVLGALVTVSMLPWLSRIVQAWPFCLLLPKKGDKVGLGRFIA
jgi:hypothetical protein